MIFMFAEKIVRKYRDIRRLMNVCKSNFEKMGIIIHYDRRTFV